MKKINQELKKIRLLLLQTQIEFAKELGISSAAVSNWESAKRFPSVKNLKKIDDILLRKGIKFDISELVIDK